MTGRVPQQRAAQPAGNTSVLVVVGTDVHAFDRLIGYLERWYAARPDPAAGPSLIVQHGTSRPPAVPGATAFLGHEELQRAMAAATLVVTHGGPATITEARRTGHLPIVVPRDPAFREHVDNHQQLFSRRLAAAGMVRLCETEEALHAALADGLADPAAYALAAGAGGEDARLAAVARVGRIVEDLVARRASRTSRMARGRRSS
ncbi:MAG TPA: glycosyltransferase [Pilimelia sp.]|nr:glycosyltransferase [Pilimelia sp.]